MSRSRPQNWLLISFDQWRGDWLHQPWLHLPQLRRMAKQGWDGRRCYTSSPQCIPARASWLTGLTPGMLVTLGEQKILTLEDFADLASDELTGGYDIIKGERVKIQGYLEDFALSKEEADELIMSARKIIYKD